MDPFMRNLLDLETSEGVGDGGAVGETEAVPAETGEAPAETTTETPASGFDYSSPEFQQAVSEASQAQLQQTLQALGINPDAPGDQQQDGQEFEVDPFSDQFGDQLVNVFGRLLDQRLGPIEGFVGQSQDQQIEGEVSGLVNEAAASVELPEGFDQSTLGTPVTDVLQFFADGVAGRMLESGQVSQDAPRQAVEQAKTMLNGLLKSVGEAHVQAYKTSLSGDSTLLDPAVRGTGLETEAPAMSEADAARRFMQRRTANQI